MLTRYFTGARALLARALREEAGQGLGEYSLILFFVAVVAVAALTLLGHQITSLLNVVAAGV